jgi:hypothetical protein
MHRQPLLIAVGIAFVIIAGGLTLMAKFTERPLPLAVWSESPELPGVAAAGSPRANLPEIPIALNFYEVRSGRGYSVQFQNRSQQSLVVDIKLENDAREESREGRLEFGPGEAKEIGFAQGWTIVSGEVVTFSREGYAPKVFVVP